MRQHKSRNAAGKKKVLMLASVASMIDQFNLPNIRLMQQLGYEVHAACNFKQGNTCDEIRLKKLKELLREMDVRYHQWDCPRGLSSLKKCRTAYRQLTDLMRQHRFAWMHCHSPVGGALARMAAHREKVRVVYTAHGFHFYRGAPFRNWLFYYLPEKLLSYWTDVLITVNEEDYRFAKKRLHAAQIHRIPGVGIETARFMAYQPHLTREEFRKKYQLPADAKILLSVGELSRRKNHQLVISSLPQLAPEVCYLICGQGNLRVSLLELAGQLGVRERVRMPGYVEDLREIYQHADIFVFPSRQEGLPAALAEAMASGLPCLVSDIRGNREMVRLDSGRFDVDDGGDFLQKLTYMMQDACLLAQNGEQMRRQAARYDLQAAEKETVRIYRYMRFLTNTDKGQKNK